MEVEDVKILKHSDGAKLTYRSLDSNFAAKLGQVRYESQRAETYHSHWQSSLLKNHYNLPNWNKPAEKQAFSITIADSSM